MAKRLVITRARMEELGLTCRGSKLHDLIATEQQSKDGSTVYPNGWQPEHAQRVADAQPRWLRYIERAGLVPQVAVKVPNIWFKNGVAVPTDPATLAYFATVERAKAGATIVEIEEEEKTS